MRDKDYKTATKELNEFSAWAKEQRRSIGFSISCLNSRIAVNNPQNAFLTCSSRFGLPRFKSGGVFYGDHALKFKLGDYGCLDGIEGIVNGMTA